MALGTNYARASRSGQLITAILLKMLHLKVWTYQQCLKEKSFLRKLKVTELQEIYSRITNGGTYEREC